MAKKTTKAIETTAPTTPVNPQPQVPTGVVAAGTQEAKDKMAAVRAARGTGDSEHDVFTYVPFNPQPNATPPIVTDPRKKLAPQAMVVVNGIASLPNGAGTREALEKAITGILVTKQPVGRIVTYYQKAITDNGYATLTKAPQKSAPAA